MCRPVLLLRNPGSLSSIYVRSGRALVAAGDEVEKGQLLVSGVLLITDDGGTVVNRQKVRADADVMIRSRIPYHEEQTITFSEKKYTGKQASRVLLQILGADFALPIRKPSWECSDTLSKLCQLRLFDAFYLPVCWQQITVREYENLEICHTKEEILSILNSNLQYFMKNLEEKGVQIFENNVKIEWTETSAIASGVLTVGTPEHRYGRRLRMARRNYLEMSMIETSLSVPAERQKELFGQFDQYVKKIERALQVTVLSRDGEIKILGSPTNAVRAKKIFESLDTLARRGTPLTEQNVDYTISLSYEEKEDAVVAIDGDCICHTINGKPIKPKTLGQKSYVDAIRKKMIVFGVGPAGTGKTYLAMAMAITAFKNEEVGRIILTRPAIEAGEKLGFLPGDLQSKVDPYLRPLYDALYQIMGSDSFLKNMEKGLIEVAPLAYMRGRTLDNAFIILDEAQNTSPAQMKMFLTRIGFGSKVVITGDQTQKDLPSGAPSGLDTAMKVLGKVEDISFCQLTSKDVVRHPLVQKIVTAYEEYEKKEAYKESRQATRKKSTDKKAWENR